MPPHPLSAEALFDLGGFAHRELFADGEYAFTALTRLKAYLNGQSRELRGEVDANAWLVGDGIVIGEGSVVEPGAYIHGPCIIGRDTEIRHGAYLRGNVVVGDGCVIGHATEVKNSIFLNGAKAGHFAYVGDSILGNNVNLGAGTKLANLRIDRAEVGFLIERERVRSGIKKLGAILGDGVETGCNSVTNPGTVLGRAARLWPCAVATGYHAPNTVVTGLRRGTIPGKTHVDTT